MTPPILPALDACTSMCNILITLLKNIYIFNAPLRYLTLVMGKGDDEEEEELDEKEKEKEKGPEKQEKPDVSFTPVTPVKT